MKLGPCIVASLALTLHAAGARGDGADEKQACLQTVERAQLARGEGRLRAARDGFVMCARTSCPAAIRDDCTRWVNEVEASLPTVACSAAWADGSDVTRMTVTVDGHPLAGAQTGRALSVDPGEHTFRFEAQGALPVEQHDVIREGEKNRVLRVTFVPAGSVSSTVGHGATSGRAPVFVLGGVALVSFGTFAYLGLKGTGDLGSLRASSCGQNGTCSTSSVSSARNEILAADIVGLVGLAAVGVATWLFFSRHDGSAPPAVATWLAPAASPADGRER